MKYIHSWLASHINMLALVNYGLSSCCSKNITVLKKIFDQLKNKTKTKLMFGIGKKQNNDEGEDKTSLDLEIYTMDHDLKNLPSEEHMFIDIEKNNKQKSPGENSTTISQRDNTITEEKKDLSPFLKSKVESIPEQYLNKKTSPAQEDPRQKITSANLIPEKEKTPSNLEKVIANLNSNPSYRTKNEMAPLEKLPSKPIPAIPKPVPPKPQDPFSDFGTINKNEKPIIESQKINKPLLISAIIVFFLTIGSGYYYYFYIYKSQQVEKSPENQPTIVTEPTNNEKPSNSEPNPQQNQNELPKALLLATEKTVNPSVLTSELRKIGLDQKSDGTYQAAFYKLIDQNGTPLSFDLFSDGLMLGMKDFSSLVDDYWIFVYTPQEKPIKIGLTLKVKDEISAINILTRVEPELPIRLKGLFIDEILPENQAPVEFQQNRIDSRVRYYNFTSNDSSQSIDWGRFSFKESDYFGFATSKETMQQFVLSIENENP